MRADSLFPMELTSDIPRITITGRQLIQVEQHHGVITYREDVVEFRTGIGNLKIEGSQIDFQTYTATEVMLSGEFTSLQLGGKQG